jgi:hypothetical protein
MPDSLLKDIGRLVRATAEIEDIIFIAITALVQTTEGKSSVLLGRIAVTTALVKLQQLTTQYAPNLSPTLKTIISDRIRPLLQVRNAVAHGVYIGFHEDHYEFLSNIIFEPEDEQTHKKVFSYSEAYVRSAAGVAEELIEGLVQLYGLPVLRARRYERGLLGQPPQKKSAQPTPKTAKPKPPRGSSQA